MKRTHNPKELDQLQKIKKENDKLKRQIASLRKELARVDLDRYTNLKQTIEQHYQEDSRQEGLDILEKVKKEWACKEPGCSGYLEIFLFNKINATHYYRKCNCCSNRTKSQKYTPEVKGIVKNPQ
jgi:hypothetical protein